MINLQISIFFWDSLPTFGWLNILHDRNQMYCEPICNQSKIDYPRNEFATSFATSFATGWFHFDHLKVVMNHSLNDSFVLESFQNDYPRNEFVT